MNSLKIAAALRVLALAFEADEGDAPAAPAGEPQKRGRGRPVKGEDTAAPATGAAVPTAESTSAATGAAAASLAGIQTTAPASVVADDPFAAKPAAPAVPAATLDQVRESLTLLRTATSQDNAVAVLKAASGASNLTDLTADKYGAVVAAATAALPPVKTAQPVVEVDPFAAPAGTPTVPTEGAATPAVKPLTIEDVKAAVVEAQKRTSQDTVQKVVMANGGKANKPDGGGEGPSLKALPEANFAATIAALKALPATK